MAKKSDKPRDPTQIVPMQIRIREGLRAALEKVAKKSGHAMNSEIADRLALSLKDDASMGQGQTRQVLSRIAGDIALIESQTGLGWAEDIATHEAVRLLVDDTLKRLEPRPENYEAGITFMQESNEMSARESVLAKVLLMCGALKMRPENELTTLLDMTSRKLFIETDEVNWRYPEDSETPLDQESISVIKERLQEYNKLCGRKPEMRRRMDAILAPKKEAKARGEAIYKAVTKAIFEDIDKSLGPQHGS